MLNSRVKKLLLIVLWALSIPSEFLQAQTLPIISTDEKTVWYYIQFKNSGSVLQDMGDNTDLKTQDLNVGNTAQHWKVTGTIDDYVITSQEGRSISFSTATSRFKTSKSQTDRFKLISSTNLAYLWEWELQRSGSGYCMNHSGDDPIGKQLNEDLPGDPNNPIEFVLATTMDHVSRSISSVENLTEATLSGIATAPPARLSLWYRTPATEWMTSALPIGNGDFGAMIFGGVRQDQIQFNEKTLWEGSTTTFGNYQNFGSLYIRSKEITKAQNYRRELDLENSVARVRYESDSVTYTREYIASNPDSVIVINLTASEPGKISCDLILSDGRDETPTYSVNGASFSGNLTLLKYYAQMSIQSEGGIVTANTDGVHVQGANELMIVLKGGTDYDAKSLSYVSNTKQLPERINRQVTNALTKSFETLKDAHTSDYKSLFDRVKFEITNASNAVPTNQLINSYNSLFNTNLFLEQLHFNYGRYLMISCSRGVDSPSNLQGIWNHRNDPPWRSDIHSNINVEMNYWPAEMTNLSELHKPFLNYIYNESQIHKGWKQNAIDIGQTEGWTLQTINNLFGYSGPQGHNYPIANAWYCMHMWQHYRFTLDKEYLRNEAYPVMKSCCKFWLERLIQDSTVNDGTWVCPKEYSPEQGPDEDGTAHSQQLVWDLFNNTLQAIDALGNENDSVFVDSLNAKFDKLDNGLHIDSEGHLREWKYTEKTIGQKYHRHCSHLLGLHPGNQISPLIDKTIFDAAIKSLTARGDVSTGWAMGWRLNLWARALDGDHAYKILKSALKLSTCTIVRMNAGGIYENLFDAHAPFQIDGNFGYTSGVTEMLLQSQLNILQILPALPSAWQNGSVSGLRAVGNFEVDIAWEAKKATSIVILSESGQLCDVSYKGIANFILSDTNNSNIPLTKVDDDRIQFPTVKGMTYTLTAIVGLAEDESLQSEIRVVSNGYEVTVLGDNIASVSLYSVVGAPLFTVSDTVFNTSSLVAGYYLVAVTRTDGTVYTTMIALK